MNMELKAYLEQALASFEGDPPDSQYQRGYLAAIIEIATVCCPEVKTSAAQNILNRS